jgi:hypothetical protein
MFEIMEITQEEKEKILRDRVETARKAEIDECVEIIKRALERIDELGGSVYDYFATYKNVRLVPKEIRGYYHKN